MLESIKIQIRTICIIKLELCRAYTPRTLQYSAALLFYDLTTFFNTELEHAQLHQHTKRVGAVNKPQACRTENARTICIMQGGKKQRTLTVYRMGIRSVTAH